MAAKWANILLKTGNGELVDVVKTSFVFEFANIILDVTAHVQTYAFGENLWKFCICGVTAKMIKQQDMLH